jgi:transposase
VLDRLFVCADEWASSDGYRLLRYRSTRRVDLDQATQARRVQRALAGLTELRERLLGPRTRFRQRAKVEQAVEEILRAYKGQPLIEKRLSRFKTDFAVAPVYLQDIGRIQGLLAVYFFVLLMQTLLERELRRAMAREELDSLPLYPEGRACSHPTTHRVV